MVNTRERAWAGLAIVPCVEDDAALAVGERLTDTLDLNRFWWELLLPATHSRARTIDDSARGRLYALTPYVSMFIFEYTRPKQDTFHRWKVACRETDSGVNSDIYKLLLKFEM